MKERKHLTPASTEVQITALSHDGRGIARCDGKTLFVTGALTGEKVKIKYTKMHASFDEAIAKEILVPASDRRDPTCKHYGLCGGCHLQHLSIEAQIQHKQDTTLERLNHHAKTKPKEILPPLMSPSFGYRHRARLSVRFDVRKNKMEVGFREKNTQNIAALQRCEILVPSIGEHLQELTDTLASLKARRSIAHIEVVADDQSTALIIRNLTALASEDIEKLTAFAQKHSLTLYLQPKEGDSIHGIYPPNASARMHYQLPNHGLTLHFHPRQFTQINPKINRKMIDAVLSRLTLTPEERVLDLFCGIGNFTLPIAQHCQSVVGIEGEASSVRQAISNSQYNQIQNAQFYVQDLFLPPFQGDWASQRYAKLLLDPPRAGAKELMNQIKRWHAKKIVYVSCHPSTLARDAEKLTQQGYRLESVQMVDMFPQTQHAETIALFQKRDSVIL